MPGHVAGALLQGTEGQVTPRVKKIMKYLINVENVQFLPIKSFPMNNENERKNNVLLLQLEYTFISPKKFSYIY